MCFLLPRSFSIMPPEVQLTPARKTRIAKDFATVIVSHAMFNLRKKTELLLRLEIPRRANINPTAQRGRTPPYCTFTQFNIEKQCDSKSVSFRTRSCNYSPAKFKFTPWWSRSCIFGRCYPLHHSAP